MRINKFIAGATGLSRRAADQAISEGRVAINGRPPSSGTDVGDSDSVTLDNQPVTATTTTLTIMLNKPVGYVCSRDGQGSKTVYDLLPEKYRSLKPVGRLDKDSSGLLLLTTDGELTNQLTHPRYQKEKVYEITLDKPLAAADQRHIEQGVAVDDYVSRLRLLRSENLSSAPVKNKGLNAGNHAWRVTMAQGRNRQIRRSFAALGYTIQTLRRTHFGPYELGTLPKGQHVTLDIS
ncbi:MAG: pseudouridine synthase [Candidatus Saccharimonadales bacterium]